MEDDTRTSCLTNRSSMPIKSCDLMAVHFRKGIYVQFSRLNPNRLKRSYQIRRSSDTRYPPIYLGLSLLVLVWYRLLAHSCHRRWTMKGGSKVLCVRGNHNLTTLPTSRRFLWVACLIIDSITENRVDWLTCMDIAVFQRLIQVSLSTKLLAMKLRKGAGLKPVQSGRDHFSVSRNDQHSDWIEFDMLKGSILLKYS